MGSCLGAGIVVGLSEGGIVVVGGNVVVKALGGKVDVAARMCDNVAMGGIVGISVRVAVGDIVGVSGKVAVGCVVIRARILCGSHCYKHWSRMQGEEMTVNPQYQQGMQPVFRKSRVVGSTLEICTSSF